MRTTHRTQWKRSIGQGLEQLESRMALAALPAGFAEVTLDTGLDRPTAMAIAPDGRMFVAEQSGDLRVIKNGQLLAAPFVSLPVDSTGERGLLGVTFDPSFASNRFVYVYYTTASGPIHNRVSRFTASGDIAAPGSEVPILELDNLSSATNHNGGAIHFGLDGKLYIAVGENANTSNSQTLTNLLGKVLRINANGTIPADNPFVNTPNARGEIWALGLRNPFTFSVQPGTGRIFVNDVGGSQFEEINDLVKGGNYGWPDTEGPHADPRYINPLFFYDRDSGQPQGRAITGGAFYNPQNVVFPVSYVGDYFFSDIAGGWIWKYDVATDTATEFATGLELPVDLQVSPSGDLYYLARGEFTDEGLVRMIRFTNGAPLVEIFGDRTYREGATPAPIAPTAALADPNSPNFAGGRMIVSISQNGEASDRLGIRNSGIVSTAGNEVRVGGVVIGTFSGGIGSDPLVIQFNAFANAGRTRMLLRNVVFSNTSATPSALARTIRVRLSDGDGGVSAPEVNRMRVIPISGSALGDAGGVGYEQNSPAILLLTDAVLSTEIDAYAGGSLLVRVTSGQDASNRLTIGGPFTIVDDDLQFQGVTIGQHNAGGGIGTRELQIALNGNAATGMVQQLVRAIRFRTLGGTSNAPRQIEFLLTGSQDGAGGAIIKTVYVA